MRFRVVVAAMTLLLMVPLAARAEELSLEQCLDIALEQSPAVGISRENLRSTRTQILQSYANFLPSASTSLWAGHAFQGPSPGVFVDAQGRPIQQAGFDYEFYSFSINSDMTLWDWGANYKRLSQARSTADASSHDLEYQKDVIKALVIREYYDLVRQRKLRAVQEDAVEASQRNLEQVEAFYNIGSRTKADLLQARVNLANDELALLNARNAEALAETRLKSRLNRPMDSDLDVDEATEFDYLDVDLNAEVQYMLEHRSDLMASRRRVDAAKAGLTAATNSRYPSIAGSFRYGWNDRQFADDANFFKQDYSWSFGVSLQYNIFDRFQTKSSIESARAQERIAEYNLQQAKLDAILDVKQIVLNIEQARERLDLAGKSVENAEENLRLAEERYRVGAGTVLETIQASASLTLAQASLIEAQVDYAINRADLNRATGRQITTR
jgi:outer membrane protein TolC